MGILKITTDVAGQIDVFPRRVKIITTDSLATVTAAGYLNNVSLEGYTIYNTDIIDMWYGAVSSMPFQISSPGNYIELIPSISNGIITLNNYHSNITWFDVTCSAAALASAGKVNVQVSAPGQQYKVRNVLVNYSAAGLSGGGGDRLLKLTDGTTSFNNAGITAALLGTPVNTVWGGSGNPLPGTVAMNTSTVAGANLYFQYSGGTSDFGTGSVVISVQVERVA